MAFDQSTRNRLNRFVADSRGLLATEFTRQLQATYGMNPVTGEVANINSLAGLTPHQQETAQLLRDTFEHYLAANDHSKSKSKEKENRLAGLDRIVREQAFTVLNRLAALRMSEARGFLTESLANGYDSKGFQLFHRIAGTSLGETGDAYIHYLFSLFDEFTLDLSVLFDRFSAQGRLFPSTPVLLELLALINNDEVAPLWAEDETIGWIYQYFNSQEERKKMRDASQAPRNSRELAVRNQFFTPRYVVEFLTDNTLGRIWYEMTKGQTKLVDECEYLVKRPNEIFLNQGEQAPEQDQTEGSNQEELLKQAVYIEHRALKDPRDIKMLDPACGSMHFGLYCFDLFERIYDEAWDIEAAQGQDVFIRKNSQPSLTQSYNNKAEFLIHVPRLIIEHNIHGVDIDPRAAQVAGMSLWQRAHNSWQQAGIKPQIRPQITKSNIVCAEPMPGEKELLQEFASQLKPTVLGQLVEVIFEKMQLAGEAGTLLKIEKEIEDAIAGAKSIWQQQDQTLNQFPDLAKVAKQRGDVDFDVSDIDDEGFWQQAEQKILDALAQYASSTASDMTEQKRLFASDAAKGFAFIDLCKKRFDVVLMNPPFGQAAISTRALIERGYKLGKSDLAACFITRGRQMLSRNGKLGCLATRLLLSLPSFESWRLQEMLGEFRLTMLADLGYGVLDAAVVEAAAYIQSKQSITSGVFLDCLQSKNKFEKLKALVRSDLNNNSRVLEEFKLLPASVIAHFVSSETINRFKVSQELVEHGVRAYKGINTADDFRFLRLSWEVSHSQKCATWRPFAKGGEWNPFWDDTHLQVNWNRSGEEISVTGGVIRNFKTQGMSGLTYPERTTSSFGPRILPENSIYSSAGMGVFAANGKDILSYLGLLLSRQVQFLIEVSLSGGDSSVSGTAARHYTNGMINRLPIPDISDIEDELSKISKELVDEKSLLFSTDETTSQFNPLIFMESNIERVSLSIFQQKIDSFDRQAKLIKQLDVLLSNKFGYCEKDLISVVGPNIWKYKDTFNISELESIYLLSIQELISVAIDKFGGGARFITKNNQLLDRRVELISHLLEVQPSSIISYMKDNVERFRPENFDVICFQTLSFILGRNFGRWENISSQDGGTFDEPRSLSFGINSDIKLAGGYESLNIDEDTFNEFITLSGANNTTELWSKFFDYHLNQYSKSRRQAPIYWLIQTPSKGINLWLYYHSLTSESLYNIINNFIEPNIDIANQEIFALQSKSNLSNKELKLLDTLLNEIDELTTLKGEVGRLATFWHPNLNDGVMITAAPLWRLFQHTTWQKKLKQTWEQLQEGEFDWAHLAFSTWPERVLKKCHVDRSLAIAHNVENDLWHEVEVIKKNKKEPVWEWQAKPFSSSELNSYINEKIATDERLKLYRSNQANHVNGGKL
jgi:hypothetical protein